LKWGTFADKVKLVILITATLLNALILREDS